MRHPRRARDCAAGGCIDVQRGGGSGGDGRDVGGCAEDEVAGGVAVEVLGTRFTVERAEARRFPSIRDLSLRTNNIQVIGPPSAEPASPGWSGRVALAHVAGRWVAHPLDGLSAGRAADAVVLRPGARRVELELLRTPADAAESIVLMGCAPALGLLADRLNGRRGPGRFLWLPRSSTQALQALASNYAHVAGVHLVDEDTGEANVPDVRRHARRGAFVVITLARWEAGLLTAPHNPKRIRAAAQLGRKGLRLVSREPGSGARRLLERELRRAGLPLRLLQQAQVQATGHLEVAQAVAHGACDVGVATRDAALAFGLEFIPLAEERYDLALSADQLADPRLARLLDMLSTAAFRRDLTSLGYDPQACGQRVAELRVA